MNFPFRKSPLAIAVAAALAVANASAAPVGSEFQVNQGSPTGLTQPSADSAADGSGNFVVAWEANNDPVGAGADGPGVEAAIYDAAGNLQPAGVFGVNTDTALAQTSPSVAMNTGGNFVVVWEDQQDGYGDAGVAGQRFDSAGTPLGNEIPVPQDQSGNQFEPQVALADDGSFMIAWEDQLAGTIEMRMFDNTGAPTTVDTLVSTDTTNNFAPAIGVSSGPSPQFVVAWSGIRSTFDDDGGIFFQRFDAAGVPSGANVLANSSTLGFQTNPAVGVDSGRFVVAWEGPDGGVTRAAGVGPFGVADSDIVARRFDTSGNPLDLDFLVNATTAGNQGHASVALAPSGDFVIAWTGDDADGRGLFYTAYDSQGSPLPGQSDAPVNTTTALNQEDPEVAMDDNANFVVAWRGELGGTSEIFAQRYSSPFALVDLILEAKAQGALSLSPFVLLSGALLGMLALLRRFSVRR